ncbi:hypothetical protein [Streptomyces sp. 4R-3d]|uniref:hypothetical protein n=1 Tax=Streptomyces sp. 4R-3d TaxID=2559605 RepID=UPI0010716612|nr:hypothetical protein [Streptomyces sp. 4R-3d]TFI30193.1 hypothetical protein E4P36_05460 [Streptomyces sp. 4R-3d]
MADSTEDRIGRQWVATDEVCADKAWRAYIVHTIEECTTTCRTIGVDCLEARDLKQAWNKAKAAV